LIQTNWHKKKMRPSSRILFSRVLPAIREQGAKQDLNCGGRTAISFVDNEQEHGSVASAEKEAPQQAQGFE
jgi:hypothetical protein